MNLMSLMGLWVDRELFILLKMVNYSDKGIFGYLSRTVTSVELLPPRTITRRPTMPNKAYEWALCFLALFSFFAVG